MHEDRKPKTCIASFSLTENSLFYIALLKKAQRTSLNFFQGCLADLIALRICRVNVTLPDHDCFRIKMSNILLKPTLNGDANSFLYFMKYDTFRLRSEGDTIRTDGIFNHLDTTRGEIYDGERTGAGNRFKIARKHRPGCN